ncbi:MAG: glycosyltransferase family 1 protein [Sphingobacteriaceae bacterium]|nr:MAG: glycosyltransferase family 1 protein [Sphingobacteriaceae bacterium]
MPKILFDHQTFTIQRYGGLSRYFADLHDGLNKLPGVKSEIATLYSENEYINDADPVLNKTLGKKLFTGHFGRTYRWNKRYCRLKIKMGNFDVLHPTYYDPYFLADLKKPYVITIPDMIYEVLPHQFEDNVKVIAQKKMVMEHASAIVAISEYTKQDIIKFYPQFEDKIAVIPLSSDFTGMPAPIPNTIGRFILFVGERKIYKNFIAFVKAIAPLLNEDKGLKLVCTGGGKFSAEEEQLLTSLHIANQCLQINAVENELKQLYAQAQVFVFPSYQEGFGIPLLEAFHASCPVAAANASCFPEIGGDAPAYFDPHSADSMYNTIKSVINDDQLRAELIRKGKQQVKLFSAEKVAERSLALYNKVVNG